MMVDAAMAELDQTVAVEGQAYPITCAPPLPLQPGAFGTSETGTIQLVEVPTAQCPSGWQIQVTADTTMPPITLSEVTPPTTAVAVKPAGGAPAIPTGHISVSAASLAGFMLVVLLCGVAFGAVITRSRRLSGSAGDRRHPPANPALVTPRPPKLPPGGGGGVWASKEQEREEAELRIGRRDSWS